MKNNNYFNINPMIDIKRKAYNNNKILQTNRILSTSLFNLIKEIKENKDNKIIFEYNDDFLSLINYKLLCNAVNFSSLEFSNVYLLGKVKKTKELATCLKDCKKINFINKKKYYKNSLLISSFTPINYVKTNEKYYSNFDKKIAPLQNFTADEFIVTADFYSVPSVIYAELQKDFFECNSFKAYEAFCDNYQDFLDNKQIETIPLTLKDLEDKAKIGSIIEKINKICDNNILVEYEIDFDEEILFSNPSFLYIDKAVNAPNETNVKRRI